MAEKVLEHSPHCLLASEGAERFALSHGITPVPNESLISPDAKKAWNHFKGSGPNYDKLSTQEGFSINETGHDTIGMTAGPWEPGWVAEVSIKFTFCSPFYTKDLGKLGNLNLINEFSRTLRNVFFPLYPNHLMIFIIFDTG